MIPDFIEFSTVLVAPGIQPGGIDSSDLPILGAADEPASLRTPVLTAFRFPAHLVQIQDPRVQFTAPEPTEDSIERMEAAVSSFVEDFVGGKGVAALGHNVKFRRRHPKGTPPSEFFESIFVTRAFEAIETTKPIEVTVEFWFWPSWCTNARVRLEPSRVDDLQAIYFDFNFHFDLSGEDVKKQLTEALSTTTEAIGVADRVCNELLSTAS